MPPVCELAPEQLHATSRAALIGGTAFTYHSERFNALATHIQHCPREPRDVHRASGPWSPPANRVRNATESGYVDFMIGSDGVCWQALTWRNVRAPEKCGMRTVTYRHHSPPDSDSTSL